MTQSLDIRLDRSSRIPLYFQVAEQMERAIVSGVLRSGDKISNEITLAGELGLSRPTMRQAIQLLVDKGMLVRKRGVGTQVVRSTIRRPVELTSLYDDLAAAGTRQNTTVLSLEEVPADQEVAQNLQVEKGEPVWSLRRLREVSGQPLALMRNFLPRPLVDLRAAELQADGLYNFLRSSGIHIRVAHERIGARTAETEEGRLLGIQKGAPLLTMSRIAYNDAGIAVEYGVHAYRSDLYSFEVTLVNR